jgi:hypothetical protein
MRNPIKFPLEMDLLLLADDQLSDANILKKLALYQKSKQYTSIPLRDYQLEELSLSLKISPRAIQAFCDTVSQMPLGS